MGSDKLDDEQQLECEHLDKSVKLSALKSQVKLTAEDLQRLHID